MKQIKVFLGKLIRTEIIYLLVKLLGYFDKFFSLLPYRFTGL